MSELDNLAPEQPFNEGQPQLESDANPLIENGKILGKYETPEAAKEGYWNAVQEMNRTKEQLSAAMQIIQNMQTAPQIPQAPQVPDYASKLEAVGVPVNELDQLVSDRASKIASAVLEQQLAPLIKGAQARTAMANSYSDFAENENAIFSAVRSNPNLSNRFESLVAAGMPHEALELGYFHWKNSNVNRPNPAVEAARRAAMMPSGNSGASRMPETIRNASPEQLREAEIAAMNGDVRPLMNIKMRDIPLTYSEQMEALMRGRN